MDPQNIIEEAFFTSDALVDHESVVVIGPTPPECSDLCQELQRIEPLFDRRNRMIWEMRRLLNDVNEYGRTLARLLGSIETTLDDWRLYLPILDTYRRKARALMSGARTRFTVASYSPTMSGERRADLCEAFLRLYRIARDEQFRRSGSSGTVEEAIRDIAQTEGHVYQVVLPNPGSREMPLRVEIWDATEVYPVWGISGMSRCYRKVRVPVSIVREIAPLAYPNRDQFDEVDIVQYYDDTWMAIFDPSTHEWIAPPSPHYIGRIPVIASFYNGMLFSKTGERSLARDEVEAYRGVSAYWHARGLIEALRDLYTAAIDQTTRAARGKFVTKLPEGDFINVDRAEGIDDTPGVAVVPAGTQVEQVFNRAGMPALESMIQRLLRDLYNNLWELESPRGHEVALERIVATREQLQFFQPYYEHVDRHLKEEFELALMMWRELRRRFPALFPPLMVAARSGRGKDYFEQLEWSHIPEFIDVRVRTRTSSDIEILQKGQVAATLRAQGIVSNRYIGENFLEVEDFDEMERQIEEDMIQRLDNPIIKETLAAVFGLKKLRQELEGEDDPVISAILQRGISEIEQKYTRPPQPPQPPPGQPPVGEQIPPELLQMMQMAQAEPGAAPLGGVPGQSIPEEPSAGNPLWAAGGIPRETHELEQAQQIAALLSGMPRGG